MASNYTAQPKSSFRSRHVMANTTSHLLTPRPLQKIILKKPRYTALCASRESLVRYLPGPSMHATSRAQEPNQLRVSLTPMVGCRPGSAPASSGGRPWPLPPLLCTHSRSKHAGAAQKWSLERHCWASQAVSGFTGTGEATGSCSRLHLTVISCVLQSNVCY